MAAKKSKRKKKKAPKGEKGSPVLLAKLDNQWNNALGSRKGYDWKWFIYDLWVFGLHYARWDRNTEQIYSPPTDVGKPKVVVNKIYSTIRAIRNYALRSRPRPDVIPMPVQEIEEAEDKANAAKGSNWLLYFLHEKLNLRTKLRGSMWHALKYSVGFWQVLWNEDANDGEGEIDINVVDPYDLYFDPNAKVIQEARYIVLSVRRTMEDLEDDEKYDQAKVKKVKPDDKLSSSTMKARIMQIDQNRTVVGGSQKANTVIVREHWYKKKDKKTGKMKYMLATLAGDQFIREPFDTGLNRFPFFRLPADIDPMSLYGQGWVKNLIPLNKLIDRLESSVAEWHDIMNKGKWVSDKGAVVGIINNENGQIIETKRGQTVTHVPIAPLSGSVFTQIENANKYMEDIGGAHEASLGDLPSAGLSGRAIEALQIGDSNNLSELVENAEVFLEQVYEYVLYLASQKYQFARDIVPVSYAEESEFVQVIGESATNVPEGATVIPEKNIVDVKITSWLAYTPEVRREVLKELFAMQVIDKETLLKGYEIGNVADIIKKVAVEREEEMVEGAVESRLQEPPAEPEPEEPGAPPGQAQQQAIAVIRQIIEGGEPQPLGEASPEVLAYIDDFLASPEGQGLPPETLRTIQMYRDQTAQQPGVGSR